MKYHLPDGCRPHQVTVYSKDEMTAISRCTLILFKRGESYFSATNDAPAYNETSAGFYVTGIEPGIVYETDFQTEEDLPDGSSVIPLKVVDDLTEERLNFIVNEL